MNTNIERLRNIVVVTESMHRDGTEEATIVRFLYQSVKSLLRDVELEQVEMPEGIVRMISCMAQKYERYRLESSLDDAYERKIVWAREKRDVLRWIEECVPRYMGYMITKTNYEPVSTSDEILGSNDLTQGGSL